MFEIPYLIIVGRSNDSPQPYTRISLLYGDGQVSPVLPGNKTTQKDQAEDKFPQMGTQRQIIKIGNKKGAGGGGGL